MPSPASDAAVAGEGSRQGPAPAAGPAEQECGALITKEILGVNLGRLSVSFLFLDFNHLIGDSLPGVSVVTLPVFRSQSIIS